MSNMKLFAVALASVAILLASCGGGTSVPPPDSFDRLTAVVYGNNGSPLGNLQVRVEGQDTGVSTNSQGTFTLRSDQFPKGVQVENEISLGSNGVVVGSRSVIPVQNQDLVIRFDPTNVGTGSGSLGGSITDDASGQDLNGVEVTIFSEDGGVQTTLSSAGLYSFSSVAEGTWNIVANVADYYPGMAMVRVATGETSVRNIELTRKGNVGTGDGIRVSGRIVDSATSAGVAGATVSMMVDTGYFGIPEPMPFPDDDLPKPSDPNIGSDGGQTEPGFPGDDSRNSSMIAPDDMWRYEPQYQEVVTDASGNFEFPDEVAGYSAWLNVYKDGYLNGSQSQEIQGRTSDLDLEISIDPLVYTTVSGTIVDDNGQPIKGAYVEYVFGGGYATDIAMPGVMDMDSIFDEGVNTFNNVGAPTPPPSRGDGNDSNMEPAWESPQADFAEGSPNSGGGGSSSDDGRFDNNMLQRFRWEQQNSKGSSFVNEGFNGYFATWTDDNGQFSFEEVPAGPYYVFASAYRHVSYSNNVAVEPNEADNIVTITLPEVPVGSVTGKVTDEDGNPLPDVLVNATQPNVDPFSYSDASGNFTIDNIPAGEWTVSGYRNGYLTQSLTVEISDGKVSNVALMLQTYVAPPVTTGNMSGRVIDGYDDSLIAGADLVFTPRENELGGDYFSHVVSDANGRYSTSLAQVEYNLLIQKGSYEDIFIRIWPEEFNREMDFWMWPIGAPGGSGGGGGGIGIGIEPGWDGDGSTDPAPPQGDPGSPDNPIGI
jgi:protocatechuate 3,4-dioxygenase beta subunit